MVHQHFTLVDSLSVTENILLGLDEPRFWLDMARYQAKVGALAEETGLAVDPAAKVWQLSVGEQQRVEILKMLYRGATILIMDEPTAVLAPQEIDELFATLRSMTAAGASIVFISHKLDEVLRIADRVTVMRRGIVTAAAVPAAGKTKRDLAQLMVGREVLEVLEKIEYEVGSAGAAPLRCQRHQRPWPHRPARRGPGHPLGRDPGAGRGGRERTIGAGRGDHRAACLQRQHHRQRPGAGQSSGQRGHRCRCRARAGGSHRHRQRAQPLADRQPHHEVVPCRAHRQRLDHQHGQRPRPGAASQGCLRGGRAIGRHGSSAALRWQPAAAHPRARDQLRARPDGGGATDTRPRRRRHRDGPPVAAEAACGRHRGAAHQRGPRRDPDAGRSRGGHLRGAHQRAHRGRRRPKSRSWA